MQFALDRMVDFERPKSFSQRQYSALVKLFVSQLINTAFIIIIMHQSYYSTSKPEDVHALVHQSSYNEVLPIFDKKAFMGFKIGPYISIMHAGSLVDGSADPDEYSDMDSGWYIKVSSAS
jgi:hypothetical protein